MIQGVILLRRRKGEREGKKRRKKTEGKKGQGKEEKIRKIGGR